MITDTKLTAPTVKLNEVEPQGFTAPGKSLISEVEKLRGAVLLLCELQRELAATVNAMHDGKAG